MKRIGRTLTLFFLLLCCGRTIAQTRPARDAIQESARRQLSSYLTLSSSQDQALFNVETRLRARMDSLAHGKSTSEQRRSAMTAALKEHDVQVRSLLTDEQWKKYKDLMEKRRASFRKTNAGKHIQVNELPRQLPQ